MEATRVYDGILGEARKEVIRKAFAQGRRNFRNPANGERFTLNHAKDRRYILCKGNRGTTALIKKRDDFHV